MSDLRAERLGLLGRVCNEANDPFDEAALLEETFVALYGDKPERVYGGTKEWEDWLHRHNPFYQMLKLKAYESAALSLIPEGWWIERMKAKPAIKKYPARSWVELYCESSAKPFGAVTGSGPTIAMALANAILKIGIG